MIRVLIGCECSGRMRNAFRALGFDAWSCDLKPSEDNSHYHIQGDLLVILKLFPYWDLLIAHPVCKYMSNAGAKHLYINGNKQNGIHQPRWIDLEIGAKFYADVWQSKIPFVAVENPIWHDHANKAVQRYCTEIIHPKKRQFIQPWMFGHMESKATGLALRRLPPLKETINVYDQMMLLPINERHKIHYMAPGPEREANRSRTYEGIAAAMAFQWGNFLHNAL